LLFSSLHDIGNKFVPFGASSLKGGFFMLDFLTGVFTNVWTYAIMIMLGLGIGWKFFAGLRPKSTRAVINKKNLLIAGLIGFLLFSGILGSVTLGFGSVSASNVIISSRVTTNFQTDSGGTIAKSSSMDNTIDVRLTDAQAVETDGSEELSTGVIQVTRKGGVADSCSVRAVVPKDYLNQDGSDQATMYHLVERSGSGSALETEVYLSVGSSSSAATTSSPTMTNELAFAEGVSVGYVGVTIELDEEGHDAMNQYESLPVYVDICGELYTFNFFRMD
jgi:hypothetical protein